MMTEKQQREIEEMEVSEELKQLTVQKHSFPEPAHDWTARHKKHAIYTTERDGKPVSMPAMEYLKILALDLPPMLYHGTKRRVVHFEELRKRFMRGKTKDESMNLVNEYCSEVVQTWNEAVKNNQNKAKMKLFAINETEWVAAHTKEEAIEHEALEPNEVKSIEEIPEREWDEKVEVVKVDEGEEAEEPETMWVTIRQLMQPAIESGKPAKIMTEEG